MVGTLETVIGPRVCSHGIDWARKVAWARECLDAGMRVFGGEGRGRGSNNSLGLTASSAGRNFIISKQGILVSGVTDCEMKERALASEAFQSPGI